ncbi:hypothetical protein DOY81_001870 [Sarcophaga bullata]|nr:hypothetical protein DOY81_001870 [Sarcophaga bullata]
MSLFFGQPHPGDKDKHLREFLSHLFMECMIRYQNDTIIENQTETSSSSTAAYPTANIPRYLEEAVLYEGAIDIENVDEKEAERNELYATINSITLATTETEDNNNDDAELAMYDTNDIGNYSFITTTSSSISSSSSDGSNNGNTGSISLSSASLNNLFRKPASTSSVSLYCPVRFDGYLCWPRTPAGTVLSQYCPDFVEGFNSKFLAHKTGQEWSNYTNCIDYEDLEFRTFVNELYVKGYAVSCVALIFSLIIFLGFKSLRCTRIRIHVHLFLSLAFTCLTWIMWYKLVVEQPDNIRNNPYWCIGLHLVIHYFMLVNYFWMFCEGLHLHLVLVVVFVKDTIVMRWFKIFSWLSPFMFLIAYGVARFLHVEDNLHCWMDDSLLLWIFSVPVCLSLVASFFFLINVLRVIVRKLHPQSAQPAPLAIRKAVRATIILVPLFGLQHFLLPYRPDTGSPLERFYQLLSVILVSLQGFVVSFLFCFANHDVTFAVRSLLNRLAPSIISPPPPSSHTGQMATTTPSRELGV